MNSYLLLLSLGSIIFVSGCLGTSPEDIALLHPTVQDFLNKYPNSEIQVTYFSDAQSLGIIQTIREDCDNPQLEAKNYYRVTIEDPDSGLSIVSWIDWDDRIVACATKKGVTTDTPADMPANETLRLDLVDRYCDGTQAIIVLQNSGDGDIDLNHCTDMGPVSTEVCGDVNVTVVNSSLDYARFDKTGLLPEGEFVTFKNEQPCPGGGCLYSFDIASPDPFRSTYGITIPMDDCS